MSNGAPVKKISKKIIRGCSVDGCTRPHKAYGYCDTHYKKFKLDGHSKLKVIPPRNLTSKNGGKCSVERCNKPSKNGGMCWGHYYQHHRHGKILERTRNDPNEFIFEGCVCHIQMYDQKCNPTKQAMTDIDDYERIKNYKWCLRKKYGEVFNSDVGFLSRFIMRLTDPNLVVDHINHNRLDNRKENLRICTGSENNKNMPLPKGNKSGYKGVFRAKGNKKWTATISVNNKSAYLGQFNTKEEAARAYNNAAKKHYGEFAHLNVISNDKGVTVSNLRAMLKKSSEHLKSRDMSTKSPSAIFNTYYTIPETLSTWVPKVGDKEKKYFIDIIPFPYGPNFPNEMWKTAWKVGDYPHTMMVDVHKNVGPEDAWVICPKNNFAERCPICEDMVRRQKNEPDAEERKKIWAALRTSRRQMYYVVVRDGDEEEDKGVQLWEVAAFYMADKLDTIRFQGRSGEVVDYWDVDDGKTIEFTIKKKGDFAEYSGHAFTDRIDPTTKKKYVISDDLIESACAFPLDQSLNRMSYDDVLKIYLDEGTGKKKTEEEEPPVSRRRTAADVVEDDLPPPISEKEEETPPPTRRRRTATVEEPETPKEGVCPSGGVFGRDCLKLVPQCDDCQTAVYNLCQEEKDRLDALDPKPRRRTR